MRVYQMMLAAAIALVLVAGSPAIPALDRSQHPNQLEPGFPEEDSLQLDPRSMLTVPELLEYYGYGAQVHHVTTEDGYILELHRVIARNGTNCTLPANQQPGKAPGGCQPVLLQHGLLASSSSWVMNYPDKALAYLAAEAGFDVWLGNARGNVYSTNHTTLDTTSYKFWDFDFDEMAKFDAPAMIDYILTQNAYPKLHWAGHSMGTTMFWVMENLHPGYASKKVASMSALGPVAYVSNGTSPMEKLAPFNEVLDDVVRDFMGIYHVMEPNELFTKILEDSCNVVEFTRAVCSNLIFQLVGYDPADLDQSWLPVILKQLNAGASTRTLVHFGQEMYDGKFRAFNYRDYNMKRYNQTNPPEYRLDKVSVPVLLKWAHNDILADPADVSQMVKEMTNTTVINSPVSNPNFNHLDFLWGIDAHELVYKDVLAFMKSHMFY